MLDLLRVDASGALDEQRRLGKIQLLPVLERDGDGLELVKVLLQLSRDINAPVLSKLFDRLEEMRKARLGPRRQHHRD